MLTTKNIKFTRVIRWSAPYFMWLLAFICGVAALYFFKIITIQIPWLPISVIGTAVAFYVGFKNNQSYDRLWEARKIWGGIVNDSRTWGMMIDGFITNLFAEKKCSKDEIDEIKKRLIYRHIAWIYVHRDQLLIPTPWEHVSQGGMEEKRTKKYIKKLGISPLNNKLSYGDLKQFLSNEEYERLSKYANMATQIINEQSRNLTQLRVQGLIDDFRHVELENVLRNFYSLQGKNERIKKFPLPRQYANMSLYFIGAFILLLPFSMIPELMGLADWGIWLAVPITAIIGWIYVMMEMVGDHSENPFSGRPNDIPMMAICRTIEIDLREMLGETELPLNVEEQNGILM